MKQPHIQKKSVLSALGEVVYIQYKKGSDFFECAGKIIADNEKEITIGFTFYLGDATDILTIKKEDIVVNISPYVME